MIPRGGKAKVRLQERLEVPSYAADLGRDNSQDQDQGNSSKDISLIDRYINGQLHVLIRIRCSEGEEFIAYLQRRKGLRLNEVHEHPLKLQELSVGIPDYKFRAEGSLFTGQECSNVDIQTNSQEQSVFVDIVQTMQNPQVFVPTLVGLKHIQFLHRNETKTRYFSCNSIFGVSVINRALEYGEASLGVHFSGVDLLDHPACEIVEGTSEVLDGISGDKRNFNGYGSEVFDKAVDLTGLWVALDTKSIWVGFPAGSPQGFQISDVLIGPIDLC